MRVADDDALARAGRVEKAFPTLIAALDDPDKRVRLGASSALNPCQTP